MPVHRDISAIDGDDGSDEGCAVEIGSPVLIKYVRRIVGQKLDALPNGHPVLKVLTLTAGSAGRNIWQLSELRSAAQRRLIAALFWRCFCSGCERVIQ